MPRVYKVKSQDDIQRVVKLLELSDNGYKYIPNEWHLYETDIDEDVSYLVHKNVSPSKTMEKFGSFPEDVT